MFSWLVASSGKIDTQVQLLQRRCTQYGLKLVPFPQVTVSRNVYLNPFKAPAILTVRNKTHAKKLDRALTRFDFIHDGVFYTDIRTILDCMEDSHDFDFERRWALPVPGRNFVHRSGTLFVRALTDRNGLCVLIVLGNYRYMMMTKDATIVESYYNAFKALKECLSSLDQEEEEEALPAETTNDQHKESVLHSCAQLDTAEDQHGKGGSHADHTESPSEPITEVATLKEEPSSKHFEFVEPSESDGPRELASVSIESSPDAVDTSTKETAESTSLVRASSSSPEEATTNKGDKVETKEELAGEPLVEMEDSQQDLA